MIQIFTDFWAELMSNPLQLGFTILTIFALESILSIDNVAVISVIANDLPDEQKNKAIKYGMWGAFVFRGVCLFFVGFLIKFWYLKVIGALYLLYLGFGYFKGKMTESTEDDEIVSKETSWVYKTASKIFPPFVSAIILIEFTDLSLSIDNLAAVVSMSSNIGVVILSVILAIITMRYIAVQFMKLIKIFPFLETCAFIVITLLGFKLMLALPQHYYPEDFKFTESHVFDYIFSACTLSIFIVPMLVSKFFSTKKTTEQVEAPQTTQEASTTPAA